MNPGIIKWNISVSATFDKDTKVSKEELKGIKKSIKDVNNLVSKQDQYNVKTKGLKMSKKKKGTIIKSKFNTDMRSPYVFNSSVEGIKNMMKWFNTAIEDRDWDHSFIINALRFKIKNTCDYIERTKRHERWEIDVRDMRIVLNLMDKLWPDEFSNIKTYDSEYSDYHVSEFKWKKLSKKKIKEMKKDLPNEKGMKGSRVMKIKEISENFNDYFAENKLMHKKAIAYLASPAGKVWHSPEAKNVQAMVISKLKHEKAKKLLFKILEERLEHWWD